jgi:DNA-directed RNA polymerase specialized sigma24 family protein
MGDDRGTTPRGGAEFARWIKALQDGDVGAWELLVTACGYQLRKDIQIFLGRRGLPFDLIDDISQKTWFTAIHRIDEFSLPDTGMFYDWLRVIALNHVRLFHRKQQNDVPVEYAYGSPSVDMFNKVFSGFVSKRTLQDEDMRLHLLKALDNTIRSLTVMECQVFLRWLAGESPYTIASAYKVKPQSIFMSLFRIKLKIIRWMRADKA